MLVTVHQVHSADTVTVTAPIPEDARPSADAMVTDRPGLLLGILTADCVPVLFADREAGVIGAAHAGWKGALGGVTDSVLTAMEKLGARRERSEEHTSELQSLMRISYAVFCLKKKNT